MKGIKYIGTREEHTDNLYGTNLVFKPGEVHNVEDELAPRFLQHTDTYEEVKPKKGEPAAEVQADKEPENKQIGMLPNLETMQKVELQNFAQQKFGENLDGRMSEDGMRSRILALIQSGGRG